MNSTPSGSFTVRIKRRLLLSLSCLAASAVATQADADLDSPMWVHSQGATAIAMDKHCIPAKVTPAAPARSSRPIEMLGLSFFRASAVGM